MIKIKKTMSIIILFVVTIPIFVNLMMFVPLSLTVRSLNQSDWLSFWGSYIGGVLGGVGTMVAVFLTINYYEKENMSSKKRIENSYEIAKIDKVMSTIHNREVIPASDYMSSKHISKFEDDIKQYNSLVSCFSSYFTDIAIGIFRDLFFIENDKGEPIENNLSNFLNLPSEIREYSYIVGKLALYENCSDLIKSHPKIGHIIEKEAGGSYGMWHLNLHDFSNEDYRKRQLDLFFKLIPSLIDKFECEKKSLI